MRVLHRLLGVGKGGESGKGVEAKAIREHSMITSTTRVDGRQEELKDLLCYYKRSGISSMRQQWG